MVPQLLMNAIIAASVYALMAISFGLIYSTVRFFHFAHGVVFVIAPYCVYLFHSQLGWPLAPSMAMGVFASTCTGALCDLCIYRPLRRKKASSLIFLIASLGIYVALQNLISLGFGDDTKTMRSGVVQEGVNILGARVTPLQLTTIGVSVALVVALALFLKASRTGLRIRAVANDPQLAVCSGISSDRVILWTFLIGSALAGVSGILVSLDTDMMPTMGMNALLMGIVAVIIGGAGSVPGSMIGAILLALIQQFGIWKIGSEWQDIIALGVLLLFLLWRPNGIFGKPFKGFLGEALCK